MALVGEGLSGRKGPGVSPGTAERCSFLSGNLGYEISLSDVNLKNSCVIPVGEAYLSPCQALGALMLGHRERMSQVRTSLSPSFTKL